MQPTAMRAVGYRRVSSQEQLDGHSLDAQTTHIQNYAQSQGWSVVQIYTDAGSLPRKAVTVLPSSRCSRMPGRASSTL